jgi:drug/metabolite transporter (DMT)-like permease
VLLGFFWLHEKLNMLLAIAVALTITGVWLVNRSFGKKS